MGTMLFHAHSGLRYAVLLVGLVAIVVLRYGRFKRVPFGRNARLASAIFTGLLDLQVLVGVATVLTRPWFPALAGHIALMVLALISAHGLTIAGRRAPDDDRRYNLALLGVIVPLLLIVGGVLAIGRKLL